MKQEVRERARQLRSQGVSVRDIARTLNVSKGTVSLWVRDIRLSHEQIAALKENQRRYGGQNSGAQRNRLKAQELRRLYQERGRIKAREGHPLHLAGCMLYWAEGAKDKHRLYFVNSDPNMVCLFKRFLSEELAIFDCDITITILCHTTDIDEIRRIEQYWLDLLGLPQSSLRKTIHKVGSEKSRHVLKHGICSMRVYRVEAVQHIYGAIQEYGGFDNPDWLF